MIWKNYDAELKFVRFFTISLRVVRTRTAESFSLADDDHRIEWEIPAGATLLLKKRPGSSIVHHF